MSLTTEKNKNLKLSTDIDKNNHKKENESLKKRKKYKLNNYMINRKALFLNKKYLLREESDKDNNKEYETTIKSNNFTHRKNERILHSARKTKIKYINTRLLSSKINKIIFNDNILISNHETDKNDKKDKSERGFMRKMDLEINNLISNSNRTKRSKTARMNNNRIKKNLNDFENNLDEYIKYQNDNNNKNYSTTNFNETNNFRTISKVINNLNEEEIIPKKKYILKDLNKENVVDINNDIKHEVLFIDSKNNLISKNNIINLLKEEEYLIQQKIKSDYKIKNFSKYTINKDGQKIILPILYKKLMNKDNNIIDINKEGVGPFMTSVEKEKDKEKEKEQEKEKGKEKEKDKENHNHIHTIYVFESNDKNIKPYIYKNKHSFNDNDNANSKKNTHKESVESLIRFNKRKKTINLNHDKFNNIIKIAKRKKRNNKKKNNSMFCKNIILNFDSKYPYNDCDLNNYINNNNDINDNKLITDRKAYTFKNLFKKSLKKKFVLNIKKNSNKNEKKEKISKTNQNTNENLLSQFDKIKKIKKSSDKNLSIKKWKKNDKISILNNLKIKKDNKITKDVKNSGAYKVKSYKLKNKDLLEIKTNYKDLFIYKNDSEYFEENDNDNQRKDINLKNFYIYKDNQNDDSDESNDDENIDDENKNKMSQKEKKLLLNNINKLINENKKYEEMDEHKNSQNTYELFLKQIEIADKERASKMKPHITELNHPKEEENLFFKNKFLRSLTNNYIRRGNLLDKSKKEEKEEVKEEEEEKKDIDENEKKQLLIDEMNLINEIKFYISTMDDPENQKKFENLLKQIDSFKKMDNKEYIKQLKDNFGNLKDEIADIFRVKEIEERINGFISNLDRDINKSERKRNFYEGLINVVDHKFKSIIEKENC